MTFALQIALALTLVSATVPVEDFSDDWRLNSQPPGAANFVSRVNRSGEIATFRWMQLREKEGTFWIGHYSLNCKTLAVTLGTFQTYSADKSPKPFALTPEFKIQLERMIGGAAPLKAALCSPEFGSVKADARNFEDALAFARKKTADFQARMRDQNENRMVSNEDSNLPFYTPDMPGLPRYKIGDTWRVTKDNSTPSHNRGRWRYYFIVAGVKDGDMAITMRAQTGSAPFPMGTVCRATTSGEPNATRTRSRNTTVTGGPVVTVHMYFKSTQDYICSLRMRAEEVTTGSVKTLADPTPYTVELKVVDYFS
jgi:hypothetical protein